MSYPTNQKLGSSPEPRLFPLGRAILANIMSAHLQLEGNDLQPRNQTPNQPQPRQGDTSSPSTFDYPESSTYTPSYSTDMSIIDMTGHDEYYQAADVHHAARRNIEMMSRAEFMNHASGIPATSTSETSFVHERTLPQPPPRAAGNMNQPFNESEPAKMSDLIKSKRTCTICMDDFEDEPRHFPYKCPRCTCWFVCSSCLKDWFLDACRNESKMPPKCCRIVPLFTVSDLLKPAEIELYKSKFEEWNTTDRLYCPVRSCSTFISPRLFSEPVNPNRVKAQAEASPESLSAPEHAFLPERTPSSPVEWHNASTIPQNLVIKIPYVDCPSCSTSICTKCRSYKHDGQCPETDLDPALEEQLKKWKIKRCPKCRSGVRKVFGCSHVECRCGAHFCFECLRPMSVCEGGCDDSEGEDYEIAEGELAEDDLDGRAGFFEGDGHEFGEEPYGHVIDTWACDHSWISSHSPMARPEGGVAECHFCFKPVKVGILDASRKDGIGLAVANLTEPGWPINTHGEPAWKCGGGHLVCNRCPKYPPAHRIGDEAWEARCTCGKQCAECTEEMKKKGPRSGWECSCGSLICGECKDLRLL